MGYGIADEGARVLVATAPALLREAARVCLQAAEVAEAVEATRIRHVEQAAEREAQWVEERAMFAADACGHQARATEGLAAENARLAGKERLMHSVIEKQRSRLKEHEGRVR